MVKELKIDISGTIHTFFELMNSSISGVILGAIAVAFTGCAGYHGASENNKPKEIPCHEVRITVTHGRELVPAFRVDFRINNVSDTPWLNNDSPGVKILHVNEITEACIVFVSNPSNSASPIFYCSWPLPNGVVKNEDISFDLESCAKASVKQR